jgi:rare lipoprotein A
MRIARLAVICLLPVFVGACGTTHAPSHRSIAGSAERGYYKIGEPYEVDGVVYTPAEDWSYDETGIASWYGPDFHGKRTANGELYDMNQVTGAHKTLPMPSLVRVTNLENGREIVVRVNDRGPFSRGRVIDLSRRGAQLLGFERVGTAKVRVQILAAESQALAQAARQGQLALDIAGIDPDQPPPLPPSTPSYTRAQPQTEPANPSRLGATTSPPPRPPDVAVVDEKSAIQREQPTQPLKGNDIAGLYMPPQQLTGVQKVHPTAIFIQAGAFSVAENAERLRSKLGQVTKTDISPTVVSGRTFYRVRIGPIATVDQADQLLSRIVGAGAGDAKIIVD